MALWAAAIFAGMNMAGSFLQAEQTRAAGKVSKDVAKFQSLLANRQAEAMESKAGVERALAQRRVLATRRGERLAQSRLQALSAASGTGGGAGDVNLAGDIATQAELQALTQKFEGEEAAKGLEFEAAMTRVGGQTIKERGRLEKQRSDAVANLQMLQGLTSSAGTMAGAMNWGGSGDLSGGGSPLHFKYGRGSAVGTGGPIR